MNIENLTLNSKKRRPLDFYPTPPEATHALMKFLNLERNISIWEPACGEGDMVRVLQEYTDNEVWGTDISFGQDYLDMISTGGRFDAIITNPPFNQSEQFIRKALREAPIVAMLLKSQYWHAVKRITLYRSFLPAYILPLTWRPDFSFKKEAFGRPTMEVAWTVWIKGNTNCKYIPLRKP